MIAVITEFILDKQEYQNTAGESDGIPITSTKVKPLYLLRFRNAILR